MNNYPIYEAIITDDGEGIEFVSLVNRPAIEQPFLAFSAIPECFTIADADQHIITGPLMLADTPIYRRDSVRGQYNIIFRPEVLKQMAQKMLSDGKSKCVSIEHSTPIEDVTLVELFIKDSTRGISPKEWDVPDGSLFGTYKVDNEAIWAAIKEGTFKGFSIEGIWDIVPSTDEQDLDAILSMLKKIRNIK